MLVRVVHCPPNTSLLFTDLPDFGLIVGRLRTEESHRGLLLSHLLAAHAAPLCLPDLAARHLHTHVTLSKHNINMLDRECINIVWIDF